MRLCRAEADRRPTFGPFGKTADEIDRVTGKASVLSLTPPCAALLSPWTGAGRASQYGRLNSVCKCGWVPLMPAKVLSLSPGYRVSEHTTIHAYSQVRSTP